MYWYFHLDVCICFSTFEDGELGIEFLPLNWKSRHVSNLFPFSYCELMEISFHTLSPIYIWYRDIQKSGHFTWIGVVIFLGNSDYDISELPRAWIDRGQNVSFQITCFVDNIFCFVIICDEAMDARGQDKVHLHEL